QEDVGVEDRRQLVPQVLVRPAADALELAPGVLEGGAEALDLGRDLPLLQGEAVDLGDPGGDADRPAEGDAAGAAHAGQDLHALGRRQLSSSKRLAIRWMTAAMPLSSSSPSARRVRRLPWAAAMSRIPRMLLASTSSPSFDSVIRLRKPPAVCTSLAAARAWRPSRLTISTSRSIIIAPPAAWGPGRTARPRA